MPAKSRFYQAPDGTGAIRPYPFCLFEIDETGNKVYKIDDDGKRIRSIRVNSDGSVFVTPKPSLRRPLVKDDFLQLRQKKLSKKKRKEMEAQAQRQAQSKQENTDKLHTCDDPSCGLEHHLTDNLMEIGESIGEED